VADRTDDALDVAAAVLADLVRLPPLGRTAERIPDGRARERRDGAVDQVSVH
jgi:hypothetical protein